MPLSERSKPHTTYNDLHKGVPPWLVQSLLSWTEEGFTTYHTVTVGIGRTEQQGRHSVERIRAAERRLRFQLSATLARDMWAEMASLLAANETLLLDTVDWLLHQDHRKGQAARTLDGYLKDGGSAWGVVSDGEAHRLEKRVDNAAKADYELAVEPSDNAAAYLQSAWSKIYGIHPDPSGAYAEAVMAVEAVANPVVLPSDNAATLGKVISAIQDAPQKYGMVLEPKGMSSMDGVLAMLKLLWRAQLRHGTDDKDAPRRVNQQQAEAAIHLAITLVQWFRSGSVRCEPTEDAMGPTD